MSCTRTTDKRRDTVGQDPAEPSHDELRALLFSISYRMLGSVGDAEDVVQDAFLQLERARRTGPRILSPRAYLTTVTTRLAIDQLRSARVRRERTSVRGYRAADRRHRTRPGGRSRDG
jgi:RNA polymerase sigma factor (sigma-70 family)